jgi:hypothetical protein
MSYILDTIFILMLILFAVIISPLTIVAGLLLL